MSLRDDGFDLLVEFERGILIGNTRALWAPFTANRRDEADPLDRYTERCVEAAFPGQRISYAHRPPYLPFQQYAVEAGFAAMSPGHLAIHPVYGPWFALRALVHGSGPRRQPIEKPCVCSRACEVPTDGNWLAMRDACSTGRAFRYSDAQVEYHYTRSLLAR